MEDAYYSMKQSKTTIHADKSMRMTTRPTILSSIKPMGMAWEDLSSFGRGPKSSQSRGFGGKGEPASSQESNRNGRNELKAKSPTGSNADDPLTIEDGPDECDFLSQKSDEGSDLGPGTTSSKKGKGKEAEFSDKVFIHGAYHSYVEGYKPRTLPSFTKKKNTQGGSANIPQAVPSVSSPMNGTPTNHNPPSQIPPGGLHKPFKPPSRTDSSTNGTPSPVPSLSTTRPANKQLGMLRQYNLPIAARKENHTTPLGERSPNTRQLPPRARSPTILVESSEEEKLAERTPRPKARPKARPLNKGSTGPTTRSSSKANPGPKLDPNPPNGSSLDPPPPQQHKEAEKARAPRPFPMDFGEGIKTATQGVKGKGKERETVKLAPFPDIPPLSSKESPPRRSAGRTASSMFPLQPPKSSQTTPPSSQATHPRTSPSPSPRKVKKPKGGRTKKKGTKVVHRTVVSSSEQGSSEDEKPAVRPKVPTRELAAFPMESQVLKSIGYSPGKRASEGSDVELEGNLRNYKRRKSTNEPTLEEILHSDGDEDDEDEFCFIDPDVDPSTLCPWCDEPLPPIPSPHLNNLIASARDLSTPDPRPSNPFGLRAIVTVFVLVCQRHSFESIQVPLAERNGWPTSIEWRMVGERVKRLRRKLQAIVEDVDEEFSVGRMRKNSEEDELWVREDEERQELRPRKGSTFWRDVIQNVKKQGSRQTAGVRGQMSSFNKTQPGYYGELGYVIINQTIYDLFPPESFPTNSTLPLTPTEFIQLVLVPEAAVALIMQDLSQSRVDAIETLRESVEYGVAMFPDDHGHAANEAGEDIVRKRAMERRKVIESEEEEEAGGNVEVDEVVTEPDWDRVGDSEEELWSQLEPFQLPPSSFEIRGKETSKDQDVELSDSGMSTRSTRSMTRRKAKEKDKEARGSKQDIEVITVSDSGESFSEGQKAAPARKKHTAKPRKPKPDLSDSQIDLCDTTDTGETSDESLQPQVTPRPMKFTSKENTIETSVVAAPLASSQLTSVEVQFKLNGKHKVLDHGPSQASIQDLDIDGTPSAKIPGSISISGGMGRAAGMVPKSKVVRSNTLRIEQPGEQSSQWFYDMRPVDDVVLG